MFSQSLHPYLHLMNSTKLLSNVTNNSTLVDIEVESKLSPLTVFIMCICVIILITGILGNSLVIVVFTSKWTVLKTYEVYIINLAVADLIATIIYPSKFLHQTLGGSFGYFGVSGCIAMDVLGTSSLAVSSFTLVVISFDR